MSIVADREDELAGGDTARPQSVTAEAVAPVNAPLAEPHAAPLTLALAEPHAAAPALPATAPPRAARRASPATLLRLQAVAGNRATQRLVDPKPAVEDKGDAAELGKEEKEPDAAAPASEGAVAAGATAAPPDGAPAGTPGDGSPPDDVAPAHAAPALAPGAAGLEEFGATGDVDPAHAAPSHAAPARGGAAGPEKLEATGERFEKKLDHVPDALHELEPKVDAAAPGRVAERPAPEPTAPLADRHGLGQPGANTNAELSGEARAEGGSRLQERSPGDAAGGGGSEAPIIPLAPDAAAHVQQIEVDANTSIEQVRSQAAAKRQQVRGFFVEKRATAAAFFTGSVQAVFGAVEQRRLEIMGWLMARALGVQATVQGLVARAMQAGTTIASMIRQGAAAITGAVAGVITGIVGRILGFARSIPIPDIPGISGIRSLVLGAADRVAAVIGRAVNAVRTFVNLAVGAVLNGLLAVMSRIGAAIVNVVTRVVAVVNRAIANISAKLGTLLGHIRGALHSAGAAAQAGLVRTERAAIGEIDRSEAGAIRNIEQNREHGRRSIEHIMDFCYSGGDYPAEPSTIGYLKVVASTSSKEEFEGSARAAMAATVQQTAKANATEVRGMVEATSSMVGLLARSIVAWLGGIWSRVQDAFREVTSRVGEMVSRVISMVSEAIGNVVNGLTALVGRLAELLGQLLIATLGVIRVPVDRLMNVGRSIYDGIRNLLRSIISRIAGLVTGGSLSADTSGLTSQAEGFTPTRLASEAQMASPPVAAGGLLLAAGAIAAAAGAIANAILVVLMWIAIIGLILAAIYVIYSVIVPAVTTVPTVPVVRRIPRVILRVPRIPRSPEKPFTWNPSLESPRALASGGISGALDNMPTISQTTPQGHHSWPKYVGGPEEQPLMGLRDTVHRGVVHPELHEVMKATAKNMGEDFTLARNRKNFAFINRIRVDLGDRRTFLAAIRFYYLGLDARTHPSIPPDAYELGLRSSFSRI